MPFEARSALNVAATLAILLTITAFPYMILGARVRVMGISSQVCAGRDISSVYETSKFPPIDTTRDVGCGKGSGEDGRNGMGRERWARPGLYIRL